MPKNIFDSSETLTAAAEIDLSLLCLKKLHDSLYDTRSPLDKIIDKATGYDIKKHIEVVEDSLYYVNKIIKNKKYLEYETGQEIILLLTLEDKLQKLKKQAND